MRRVAIIGCSGSGKSTLARVLGKRLGLPVCHLDALFWRAGWQPTPRPEWAALQRRLVAEECWIMDGNFNSTLEIRVQAADTTIFLDFPRRVCLWRVMRRIITGLGKTGPDMAPGCPEHIDFEFLKWIWGYNKQQRPHVIAALREAQGEVVRLRNSWEVRRFMVALPK